MPGIKRIVYLGVIEGFVIVARRALLISGIGVSGNGGVVIKHWHER